MIKMGQKNGFDGTIEYQNVVTPPPEESAKEAGLRYVSDEKPGITRRRHGKGFTYHGVDGELLNGSVRKRIESLVIPPAWTHVWISPTANGHIQATGRDEAGRKQYIYHEKWHEVRDAAKFHRMIAFGEALPDIRERVDKDLRLTSLCREKVLALVIYILDATGVRVGNAEYAEKNGSYGLTTLRKRHAEIMGTRLHLEFTGKSGVEQIIDLDDARVARALHRCEELPGYHLFKYLDEEGERCDVDSQDVNDYLCEIAGEGFTAKDFRTWRGSVLAAAKLGELTEAESEENAKKILVDVVKQVASELGNTPTVCRKHYIHPAVMQAYGDGEISGRFQISGKIQKRLKEWLSPEELGLLIFLKECERESR